MDVTNALLVNKIVSECKPDIILHFAANKNVEFCENNPDKAKVVNVGGVRNILNTCTRFGAFLIFMSSDYVFEGTIGNYNEQDKRNPLTIYGKTKKEAEDIIINSNIEYCIIRSGGIYGHAHWQSPLLNWASGKLTKNQVIHAFINVYNTPTCIYDLSRGIGLIARKHRKGIFHITGSQRTSRWEFLKQYAEAHGFNCDLVIKDKYTHSLKGYKRPNDLSLNASNTELDLGIEFHNIREGFDIMSKFGK